jgi:hypothetical protein
MRVLKEDRVPHVGDLLIEFFFILLFSNLQSSIFSDFFLLSIIDFLWVVHLTFQKWTYRSIINYWFCLQHFLPLKLLLSFLMQDVL